MTQTWGRCRGPLVIWDKAAKRDPMWGRGALSANSITTKCTPTDVFKKTVINLIQSHHHVLNAQVLSLFYLPPAMHFP